MPCTSSAVTDPLRQCCSGLHASSPTSPCAAFAEPADGLYLAESAKVIARALAAGHRPALGARAREVARPRSTPLLEPFDVPVYVGTTEVLESRHRLRDAPRARSPSMHRPALPEVAELLRDARRVVVLEDIVDHTNVGAIFRAVAGLGADAVLVTPRCADPLYRRSVRVSMGTVLQVPWTRLPEWPEGAAELRDAGFAIAALALDDGAVDLADVRRRSAGAGRARARRRGRRAQPRRARGRRHHRHDPDAARRRLAQRGRGSRGRALGTAGLRARFRRRARDPLGSGHDGDDDRPRDGKGLAKGTARAVRVDSHGARLDSPGLLARRDPRLRDRRGRSTGTDRVHPRLHPDVLHRLRLPRSSTVPFRTAARRSPGRRRPSVRGSAGSADGASRSPASSCSAISPRSRGCTSGISSDRWWASLSSPTTGGSYSPPVSFFILAMVYVSYRGVEIGERLQNILLGIQYLALVLFVVFAVVGITNGTAMAATPVSGDWFNPFGFDRLRQLHRRHPARDLHLLGVGHLPRPQRGDEGPEAHPGSRRPHLDSRTRRHLRRSRRRGDRVRRPRQPGRPRRRVPSS